MTMNEQYGVSLFVFAALMVVAAPSIGSAQQPKLDIKVFAGASANTLVEMLETARERDTLIGWQAGFGPRIKRRKWFVETLLSFNRWALRFSEEDLGTIKGRVNSFELPINAGYVPYQNPYFKLFLYVGYVNHFNTKVIGTYTTPDGETANFKFKPKEVNLAIYQAIARFGVNFDLAMFNVDFNYSISMNSVGSESFRTGYHQLQLNLAYLF
jgi:hypothetical protein